MVIGRVAAAALAVILIAGAVSVGIGGCGGAAVAGMIPVTSNGEYLYSELK